VWNRVRRTWGWEGVSYHGQDVRRVWLVGSQSPLDGVWFGNHATHGGFRTGVAQVASAWAVALRWG
jgi:hypothetical protein